MLSAAADSEIWEFSPPPPKIGRNQANTLSNLSRSAALCVEIWQRPARNDRRTKLVRNGDSPMSAGEERKGTRVTFLDQTGAKSVEAVIADSVSVKRILPNIITKMNLPVMGPDGQPMSYSLDHKEGGKRLREEETLPIAGVNDGHHLIVYPEIVAG
jgi:hypothetical protein